MENTPLVSVCLITYNHVAYIKQAMEGILNQKVSFPMQIVIADDFSTDGTREVLRDYEERHPGIIKLILQEKNVGPYRNWLDLLNYPRSKYVAYLEGDDYWIDPLKLQKQIDFLEAHPDFTICFTNVNVLVEGSAKPKVRAKIDKDVLTIADIIASQKNLIPSPTLAYRNCIEDIPDFFVNSISGDIAFLLLLADKGKIKYLDEKTAVYRQHEGGISKSEHNIRKGDEALFNLFVAADKYFNYKYSTLIRQRLLAMSKVRLIHGAHNAKGLSRLKYVYSQLPDYFKYSDGVNIRELLYFHLIWFFPGVLKMFKK